MSRVAPALLALTLTPALVALPTVTGHHDRPHPVSPKVAAVRLVGVDAAALAHAPAPVAADAPAGPVTDLEKVARKRPAILTPKRSAAEFTLAGVTWIPDATVPMDQVSVQIRLREHGTWTNWQKLEAPEMTSGEQGAQTDKRVGTSPLLTDGADGYQLRVDTPTGKAPRDLRVSLVNGGTSAADNDLTPTPPPSSAAASVSMPQIITRAQWGADESLRGSPTYNSTVKVMFVHHTASTNNYTSGTAASQIRSIYAYDTRGLGWSDIAYNFLVDKYGRIYEGRAGSITRTVRSAATGGFNVDSMAVSALGNYDTTAAPSAMVTAIGRVVGWKLSQYGRNPYGTGTLTSQGGGTARWPYGVSHTFDTISGHRDSGLTACPGRYLYAKLGTVRSTAAAWIAAGAKPVPPGPIVPFKAADKINADSKPDLMAIDRSTQRYYLYPGTGTSSLFGARKQIGWGWGGLDLVTGPGDLTGDGKADLLARNRSNGDLILFPGKGDGTFAGGKTIGTGWDRMRELAGVGDFDHNGTNDLMAVDRGNGVLYFYPNAGNGKWGPRRSLGGGWNKRDLITGVGDVTGDGKPDVIAREPGNGHLWLYAGNGAGGFKSGRVIAWGWNVMSDLAGVGDLTGDGRNDLLAINKQTGRVVLYAGHNNTTFSRGVSLGWGWKGFDLVG